MLRIRTITVKDLDQSIKFYTQTLGMKLLGKKDYPIGKFTLAHVAYSNDDQPLLELAYNWDDYQKVVDHGHIVIDVLDISTISDGIRNNGGAIVSETRHMKSGSSSVVYCEDPDGYSIELVGKDK